ncbi:MAG TPA: hypothetical protein DCZ10_04330 [Pelotomaculum sp.]|nr:hypothetical protein [Pelotomaculum sp.]
MISTPSTGKAGNLKRYIPSIIAQSTRICITYMDIFNSLIKKEANISEEDEHVARNILLVMQQPTLQEIGSGFKY